MEKDRSGICEHPDCDKEFTRHPKAWRQRYCQNACRIDHWVKLNPKPKELIRIYNRTRYAKHREKILAYKSARGNCHCECGKWRARNAKQCDDCAAMPTPGVVLGMRGRGTLSGEDA